MWVLKKKIRKKISIDFVRLIIILKLLLVFSFITFRSVTFYLMWVFTMKTFIIFECITWFFSFLCQNSCPKGLLRKGMVYLSLRVQTLMAGKSWQQEGKEGGHMTSRVRKQRERAKPLSNSLLSWIQSKTADYRIQWPIYMENLPFSLKSF